MTPPPESRPSASRLSRTLSVSAFTLVSRVLGLVRDQVFAALLGAGALADAFVVAFRVPNLLRDLFAEGALSAAFVPSFARVESGEGRDRAYVLGNRVVGGVMASVGALVILAMALAPQIVSLLAPGFDPDKAAVTAHLARIMAPFLLLVSLAAVTMGMLNAQERFTAPALAPALFNIAAIAVGAGLYLSGADPRVAVVGWSLGTLAGGVLQLAVQVPPLWRLGYRPRPRVAGNLADPGVRRILRLMGPATIGLAAVQINIFVNTQFASHLPGANAHLNYAFRLMYLPIGLFGVAVATVTGAAMARSAAERDIPALRTGLAQGLRHVAFLTIPSSIGLIVLAEPVIRLIYQHGRFTGEDTASTGRALLGYALGLVFYAAVKVMASAFYALDRARVPLLASTGAVATNIVFNALTYRTLGVFGLALGTALGALVNAGVLALFLHRAIRNDAPGNSIANPVARMLAAGLFMGAMVWALERWLAGMMGYATTAREIAVVGTCVMAGIAVYAGMCHLFRVGELAELAGGLRRRLGQGTGNGEGR
ncbi:MAG: murein biosynthesis integral membrane protein MurJ [Planctomycetota bacterium]